MEESEEILLKWIANDCCSQEEQHLILAYTSLSLETHTQISSSFLVYCIDNINLRWVDHFSISCPQGTITQDTNGDHGNYTKDHLTLLNTCTHTHIYHHTHATHIDSVGGEDV